MSDELVASVRIAAPPEVIFPYLTDPELIVSWIGQRADLAPAPGGVFAVDFERSLVRGTYLVVEPPHRAVFTWGVIGDDALPPGASTVEITLTPDGDATIVRLTHRGLPAAKRAPHAQGWAECLDRLLVSAGSR